MGQCDLLRFSLAPGTAAAQLSMATVTKTGFASTPGVVRRVDATINHAIIDNLKYAYTLQCDLAGTGPSAGLYGASVTYTISATNG